MQVNCVASTTTRASNEDNEGDGDDGENSVRLFCTGSDDSTVKLWDLDGGMDSEEDASEKKKRDEEKESNDNNDDNNNNNCLLYTSPSPRDKRQSRMPSSA